MSSTVSDAVKLAATAEAELVSRELARKSLVAFAERFIPGYSAGWAHKLVAANLEKFYEDVKAKRSPRLMLFLPPRFGKLLDDREEVITYNRGSITHGELEVGDLLQTPSGTPTPVTAISKKAPANYEVEISDGTKIRCHANHEWQVWDRGYKAWKIRETKWFAAITKFKKQRQLHTGPIGARGGRYMYQLPLVEGPAQMAPADLPLHPYVLGLWLGDGRADDAIICTDTRSMAHTDKIEHLGYTPTKEYYHRNYEHVSYLRYGEGQLLPHLRALKVLGNKHIPKLYLESSVEQRLELLAGLIDSDGTVDDKSRVMFSNTNEAILSGYMELCQGLNLRPYKASATPPALSSSGIQGRKTVYQLGFQPVREPYCPAIPTALKKITRLITPRRLAIVAVRELPAEEVEQGHCIQVEAEDGLYLAGKTLIPTHNSKLASQLFPAWVLGHDPTFEIIVASYATSLPMDFSRYVKGLLEDPSYRAVFPETSLDPRAQATDGWYTSANGCYFPAGVGSGITGRGCHALIIDDPVKDAEQADSETVLEKAYDWYGSTAMTRVAPGGGIAVIQTRWSDMDLSGRLLLAQEEMEKEIQEELMVAENPEYRAHLKKELNAIDDWNVVSFPAIAEKDEYITPELRLTYEREPGYIHVRKPEEAVHPARFDEAALGRIKKALPPRHWNSLYQQNPVPDEGSFFQKSYIREHQLTVHPDYPVLMAWDFAIGTKQSNDWTVGVTGMLDPRGVLHIIDIARFRGDTFEIVRTMADQIQLHSPTLVGIEKGHIASTMLPLLLAELQARRLYPPIKDDLVPVADKVVRARTLQGMMQRGIVSIPEKAPWRDDLLRELLRFPHGVHDDQVDAMSDLAKIALDTPLPSQQKQQSRKSWRDNLSKLIAGPTTGRSHMGA